MIATDTFDDHVRCLEEVASRLKKANLAINLSKSKFCQLKIQYLGYIIDENGINADPDKISAVVNSPSPKHNGGEKTDGYDRLVAFRRSRVIGAY